MKKKRTPRCQRRIHVPDVPRPFAVLCWKQSQGMVRCDRRYKHKGPHSWERVFR